MKKEKLLPVDLRTCKKGDILISRRGLALAYGGKIEGSTSFPHLVIFPNGGSGSRTNNGMTFNENARVSGDHDIVRIVPKSQRKSVLDTEKKMRRRPVLFHPPSPVVIRRIEKAHWAIHKARLVIEEARVEAMLDMPERSGDTTLADLLQMMVDETDSVVSLSRFIQIHLLKEIFTK